MSIEFERSFWAKCPSLVFLYLLILQWLLLKTSNYRFNCNRWTFSFKLDNTFYYMCLKYFDNRFAQYCFRCLYNINRYSFVLSIISMSNNWSKTWLKLIELFALYYKNGKIKNMLIIFQEKNWRKKLYCRNALMAQF